MSVGHDMRDLVGGVIVQFMQCELRAELVAHRIRDAPDLQKVGHAVPYL